MRRRLGVQGARARTVGLRSGGDDVRRLERQLMFAEVADLVICGYVALAFIYAFGAYGLCVYIPLTALYLFWGRRRLWAWHFARRVSWFRCISSDGIDLHYAQEFEDEELLREI